MTHRRVAVAALSEMIGDGFDRSVMPMSTFVASDEWLGEVAWDGVAVGDLQIFRNSSVRNGQRHKPVDEWVWWNGVPAVKIKSYRFLDISDIHPMTVDGKREAEPGKAASVRKAAAGAAQL